MMQTYSFELIDLFHVMVSIVESIMVVSFYSWLYSVNRMLLVRGELSEDIDDVSSLILPSLKYSSIFRRSFLCSYRVMKMFQLIWNTLQMMRLKMY